MCGPLLPIPIPQTSGTPTTSGTVLLSTSAVTTVAGAIGGTCNVICLFPSPDDESQIQVSGLSIVDLSTNEPVAGFGRWNQNAASQKAARKLLRSLSLPVPIPRLDICAFAARVVGPIPEGAAAEIRWEVDLNGAKPEQLRDLLGRFHGWITGKGDGRRFHHHVCFTEVEKIIWEG